MRSIYLILCLVTGTQAYAEDNQRVTIDWHEPNQYRDVQPVAQTRHKFQQSTFSALHAHLEDLMASGADGYQLTLKVTNLDLAGRVLPASFLGLRGAADIRLIERIDIPQMQFSFSLLNASGAEVKSGEAELKSMGFMDRPNRYFSNDSLRHEKEMLRHWFKQEIAEGV